MLCALIKNSIVVEVRDVTQEEFERDIANQYEIIVDVTDLTPPVIVGDLFDGHTIVGTTQSVKITKLALLNRFTDQELATIEGFALQANSYAYALRTALRKQAVATYIDLKRQDTITGINNLVALGLITQDRANTILNTPPTEMEKYK